MSEPGEGLSLRIKKVIVTLFAVKVLLKVTVSVYVPGMTWIVSSFPTLSTACWIVRQGSPAPPLLPSSPVVDT